MHRTKMDIASMPRGASMNPIDRHVGSRVRMQRLLLGMSQTELGDALGLSFQQVQKYEKGTNRIGASRLQHICQILKVPMSFFFEGSPHPAVGPISKVRPSPPDQFTEFMATRDGVTLAKSFMRISNVHLRRRIVDLVEQIEEYRR
jgi:transcriptional regulator with XRE-family HTH domain